MNKGTHLKRISELESGQAIILIALLIIALVGMLGLAVDGGGLYFLRRDAQNAVDAAVVAGTYARCTGAPGVAEADIEQSVNDAANAAVTANNFVVGDGRTDFVIVQNPISATTASDHGISGSANFYNYIYVEIQATKPSYFIQVVYQSPLNVTVHAIGYCTPRRDPASIAGMTALSKTCNNTIQISGSTGLVTANSGSAMWSNNEIQITGSDNDINGATASGSANNIDTSNSGNTSFTPSAVGNQGPSSYRSDPLGINITDFAPGGTIGVKLVASYVYHSGASFSFGNNDPTLEGVYYATGDITVDHTAIGTNGVTFISESGQIDVKMDPNTPYELKGYEVAKDVMGGDFLAMSGLDDGGSCGTNNSGVKVSGNAIMWKGVIYAPHSSVKFDLSSTNGTGFIIGSNIQFSGSSTTWVVDPNLLAAVPPQVSIAE